MIFEAVINYGTESGLVQETTPNILEPMRKQRGYDLWNTDKLNMARTKDEMRTDGPKENNSIIKIEISDRRAWKSQGKGVDKDIQLVWKIIIRWCKCNYIREFCWALRQNSLVWSSVGTI